MAARVGVFREFGKLANFNFIKQQLKLTYSCGHPQTPIIPKKFLIRQMQFFGFFGCEPLGEGGRNPLPFF